MAKEEKAAKKAAKKEKAAKKAAKKAKAAKEAAKKEKAAKEAAKKEKAVKKGKALDLARVAFDPAAGRLALLERRKLKVPGASGIVPLGEGRLAVVHDDIGVFEVREGAATQVVSAKDHPGLEDLEGACLEPGGGAILVLCEARGAVSRIELAAGGGLGPGSVPVLVGSLPDLESRANKGWEGLECLPGALSPDGEAKILAVHERDPRRLGVFAWPSLETTALLELPEALGDAASDLADIAVQPETGHVFLVSDESRTILELRLRAGPWRLEALARHTLVLKKGEKAEALAFEGDSLWLATDGKARLYRLRAYRAEESAD